MRLYLSIAALLLLLMLAACNMGKKNWPHAVESEDAFSLEVLSAERKNNCLLLQIGVTGALGRLYRASIQYEEVGGYNGGCKDCPFVPRSALHVTRNNPDFELEEGTLSLSMCSLNPDSEYRFRVAGKNELPGVPLVFTDVFVTGP